MDINVTCNLFVSDDTTHIPATVASISLHISSSKSPGQDGAPPALLLPGRLPGPGRRPPCILPHRSLLQVIIRAVNEHSLSFSVPGEGPWSLFWGFHNLVATMLKVGK